MSATHLFMFWFYFLTCRTAEAGFHPADEASGSGWMCDPPCHSFQMCVPVGGEPACLEGQTITLNGSLKDGEGSGHGICGGACGSFETCRLVNGSAACVLKQTPTERIAIGLRCGQLERSPCLNGGVCQNLNFGFMCSCLDGFAGSRCELAAPPAVHNAPEACSSSPCAGDCRCINNSGRASGFECASPEGYTGKNCTVALPQVSCHPTKMTVRISRAFIDRYSPSINSTMYLTPSPGGNSLNSSLDCPASQFDGGYQWTILFPFVDCGTQRGMVAGTPSGISFRNEVWLHQPTGSSQMKLSFPVARFECIYKQDYHFTSALQPLLDARRTFITKYGEFSLNATLCQVRSCLSACPAEHTVNSGAVYTIGETVHVTIMTMTLRQHPVVTSSLVTSVDEMYLSCSEKREERKVSELVTSGCPGNPGFPVSASSGRLFLRPSCASFQLPVVAGCPLVYIHIRVRLCEAKHALPCPQDPNLQRCFALSKRSARNADVMTTSHTIVGPIALVSATPGSTWVEVFTDKDGEVVMIDDDNAVNDVTNGWIPTKDDASGSNFVFLGIASGGALIALLVVMTLITRKHQRFLHREASLLSNN